MRQAGHFSPTSPPNPEIAALTPPKRGHHVCRKSSSHIHISVTLLPYSFEHSASQSLLFFTRGLMATATSTLLDQKLSRSPGKLGILVFGSVLLVGVLYAGTSLLRDLSTVHSESLLPYVLLGVALLVALGFEFVNGFTIRRTRWPPSSTPTRWNRISRSSGPVSGISWACWFRAASSLSPSFPCCRSN